MGLSGPAFAPGRTFRVLGIETSSNVGSVALLEETGGSVAADERSFEKGLRHGKELIPTVDALVRQHDLEPGDLDLFAVSQGPGSYTGIRVGITCAKTLAYALGKAVVGVPSLDVLAANAPQSAERVCTAIDAKRRRVYFCCYRRKEGRLVREADYRAVPVDEAAALMQPGTFLIGDAIRLYGQEFAARGAVLAPEDLWLPRAAAVAQLGLGKFRAAGPDDTLRLVPIYLHRPEAEEVWERKRAAQSADT